MSDLETRKGSDSARTGLTGAVSSTVEVVTNLVTTSVVLQTLVNV